MKLPINRQVQIEKFYTKIIRRKNIIDILINRLIDEHSVIRLEMDILYAEHLVRLFDEYYTNCVVIWDRLNEGKNISLVVNLIKDNLITKVEITKNCICCPTIPPRTNERRLETIMIYDDCELASKVAKALKIPYNKKCSAFCMKDSIMCYVVPMLTEEIIEDIERASRKDTIKDIWVFTIIEIPSREKMKKIFINDTFKGKNIRYEPLISKDILEKAIKDIKHYK